MNKKMMFFAVGTAVLLSIFSLLGYGITGQTRRQNQEKIEQQQSDDKSIQFFLTGLKSDTFCEAVASLKKVVVRETKTPQGENFSHLVEKEEELKFKVASLGYPKLVAGEDLNCGGSTDMRFISEIRYFLKEKKLPHDDGVVKREYLKSVKKLVVLYIRAEVGNSDILELWLKVDHEYPGTTLREMGLPRTIASKLEKFTKKV